MNTLPPDEHGFLRYWLATGLTETPYTGPADQGDDAMRWGAIDTQIVSPPADFALGQAGPGGEAWALHQPGHNVFVERSSFWFSLMHVDTWFATTLHSDEEMMLTAWLWAAGCADLYCNGEHIARNNCPRYMYPKRERVELPLVKGVNKLVVRLQVLGLRDSRFLFGLQCEDPTAPVAMHWPGEVETPATDEANQAIAKAERGSGEDQARRKQSHMRGALQQHTAVMNNASVTLAHAVLCARSIGEYRDGDSDLIAQTCDWIDGRPDCADFAMAVLLRLVSLDLVSDAERERIAETALAFRYWTDEAGNDAMCFTSENHRLLFHSAQLLAGRLWPGETFPAANRTGEQQASVGLERCKVWLDTAEQHGFKEYLSAGYIPITVAALMNLVDSSGDADVSKRAAALVDMTFQTLADHAFDGIVIAPQGRVYRQVLEPEKSGTQALLSYAVDEAVVSHDIWLGFLASSPAYEPPRDLLERMNTPTHRAYRQHTVDIVLHKASDYVLTSVDIGPSELRADDPSEDHDRELAAGRAGYQQHIWHASLGEGCHIFVNHPGEWIDHGSARPGYWYGNGILPRTQQHDHVLMQIYRIDEEHPVPFVHAHWPRDVFDETAGAAGWHVARRGAGYVGLWCSEALASHDQVLVGRELRAWSADCAWVCVCGSASEHLDLASFGESCQACSPTYDAATGVLALRDGTQMAW